MATRRQHIRNSRAYLEASFTPLAAEYAFDTTLNAIRVGDGATLGGYLQKRWRYSYPVSPAQITADQNDYNPTDLAVAETLLLTSDAARSITGLAGGAAGVNIKIVNRSGFDITLPASSALSLAANRFLFESDVVLRPRGAIELQYSAADSRWMRTNGGTKFSTIPQELLLTGAITPAQITANTNDYAPANITLAQTLRLSTDASRNLTGLVDPREGAIKTIINVGSNPLVLKTADTGSAVANRFDFGSDITLQAKQSATLRYDSADARWKLLAQTAGSAVSAGAVTAQTLSASALGARIGMINGTLAESRSGNAVTFSVKTVAGVDASAADPIYVAFNNGSGSVVIRAITAPLSLTISSGSSMGASNATAFRLWLMLIDTGSGVVLGAVNCVSGPNILALPDGLPYSTTAEGGAGAADNAQTIYSAVAQTGKYTCLAGYADYETGLVSAGAWASAPTRIVIFTAGTPRPGSLTGNRARTNLGTLAAGTTVLPIDNTIPQNTEGDQFLSQTITPTSACNLARARSNLWVSANAIVFFGIALFRDSAANALAAAPGIEPSSSSSWASLMQLDHLVIFGTAAATTFKVRAGPQSTATLAINATQAGAPQVFGGVSNSFLEIEEIMG